MDVLIQEIGQRPQMLCLARGHGIGTWDWDERRPKINFSLFTPRCFTLDFNITGNESTAQEKGLRFSVVRCRKHRIHGRSRADGPTLILMQFSVNAGDVF